MINKRNMLSMIVSFVLSVSIIFGQPVLAQAEITRECTVTFSDSTSTGLTFLPAGSYETVSITVTSTLSTSGYISFYLTDLYGTKVTSGASASKNYLVASCTFKDGYTSGLYYYKINAIPSSDIGVKSVSFTAIIR